MREPTTQVAFRLNNRLLARLQKHQRRDMAMMPTPKGIPIDRARISMEDGMPDPSIPDDPPRAKEMANRLPGSHRLRRRTLVGASALRASTALRSSCGGTP